MQHCNNMNKKFLLPLALLLPIGVAAQTLTPDDGSSAAKFTIKNFGLNVGGTFKGLQGKITFLPANLAASTFVVTLDAATINSGNGKRDKHLKKEEYFNVAKFPTLQFISKSITAGDRSGSYTMAGILTIKGIAKIITFPFTAILTGGGYQFAGSFSINRRDFKVGGNSLVLSDMLTVSLNVSAKK